MNTELPDKIYIRHYWALGELDDKWRLRPVEDEICEEYIRKDAILELAREVANDTNHSLVYRGAFRDLINKIESL